MAHICTAAKSTWVLGVFVITALAVSRSLENTAVCFLCCTRGSLVHRDIFDGGRCFCVTVEVSVSFSCFHVCGLVFSVCLHCKNVENDLLFLSPFPPRYKTKSSNAVFFRSNQTFLTLEPKTIEAAIHKLVLQSAVVGTICVVLPCRTNVNKNCKNLKIQS